MIYGPKAVTNGLVLALDAADRNSYPGSGDSWRDISGNGNNCTLSNGPTFSITNSGVINFDGTNDMCVGPSTISGASSSQLTLEIWTKPNSTSQMKTLMSKWGSSTLGNFSWLLFLNWFSQDYIYFLIGNAAGNNYSVHSITHQLSTSAYSHFSVTYNAGSVSMYRNGEFISTSSSANTSLKSVSTSLGIGHDYDFGSVDTPGRYYSGSIPLSRIYNRALSATEIQQNFNALRGRFGI